MYCLVSCRCCSWTIAGWRCVKCRLAVCVLHADDCECPCFAGKILFAFVYMLHCITLMLISLTDFFQMSLVLNVYEVCGLYVSKIHSVNCYVTCAKSRHAVYCSWPNLCWITEQTSLDKMDWNEMISRKMCKVWNYSTFSSCNWYFTIWNDIVVIHALSVFTSYRNSYWRSFRRTVYWSMYWTWILQMFQQ
jgi:hypothetical protein